MDEMIRKARQKRRKHQQQVKPLNLQQKKYSELILVDFDEPSAPQVDRRAESKIYS